METLVRINKEIPLTIFDEPVLQDKITNLFNSSENKIKARFNEIIACIDVVLTPTLSYKKILILFKVYFCKSVLDEAIEITFSDKGSYDILSNILSLLSEERLNNAIIGEPMIDAFSNAIRSIPSSGIISTGIKGDAIVFLEKEFLGQTILSNLLKKERKNNYCFESGCSCFCDAGCNGNTKNCTSKKALEKKCAHSCGCYLSPKVKKFPKQTKK